jgi:hypothetical protein
VLVVALFGCASKTFRTVDTTPPERIDEPLPEQQLLDVGINVFDANVPEGYDERQAQFVNEEVRRAESYLLPYVLKTVLESTGNWGAVRVIPAPTHAVDVMVRGRILISHGERLALAVEAEDAQGTLWFAKTYEALASKYAYDAAAPAGIDPFQQVYTEIADDMATHFAALEPEARRAIRRTAEMRFARELVPVAYEDYVKRTAEGGVSVKRLPARGDPLMDKARQVRNRELMFIDSLDAHYAEYRRRTGSLYQTWRQATYREAMARLKLRQQQRERALAGTLSIMGGLIGGPATMSGIATGAEMLKDGIHKGDEVMRHADALREVSNEMESAVVSHTLALEHRTHELTGTVEKQYAELRRLLRRAFLEEFRPRVAEETAAAAPNNET